MFVRRSKEYRIHYFAESGVMDVCDRDGLSRRGTRELGEKRNIQMIKYLIIGLLFIAGCRVQYIEGLEATGGKEVAIRNSILDFTHIKKLYESDNVFSIIYYDTLVTLKTAEVGDGYNVISVEDKVYDNIIALGIAAYYGRFPLFDSLGVDRRDHLPSRFYKVDEKIFYWYDDNYTATDSNIEQLLRFNIAEYIYDEKDQYLDEIRFSKAGKSATYYFCRNDLTIYKRVITKFGESELRYVEPPNLNCER